MDNIENFEDLVRWAHNYKEPQIIDIDWPILAIVAAGLIGLVIYLLYKYPTPSPTVSTPVEPPVKTEETSEEEEEEDEDESEADD